jgi:hypothetical protein
MNIYATVTIEYSDHVYNATVLRIEDIVRYLKDEDREFSINSFQVFNAKNLSFSNRLESALGENFPKKVGNFFLHRNK